MTPAMKTIVERWHDCTKCRLSNTRTNYVHGRGNSLLARLLFLGEAPGREEDKLGYPFVGRAGQKLREAMDLCGISAARLYYVANCVACWPYGNRTPRPDEVAACRPRLEEIVNVLPIRVVVPLGGSAAQAILGSAVPGITTLRGHWHEAVIGGKRVDVMPAVHPSYILRSGGHGPVWDQFLSDLTRAHKRNMRQCAVQ